MTNKPRSSVLSARLGGLRQLYGNPVEDRLRQRIAELESENRWYRIAVAIDNAKGPINISPSDLSHLTPEHLDRIMPITRYIQ